MKKILLTFSFILLVACNTNNDKFKYRNGDFAKIEFKDLTLLWTHNAKCAGDSLLIIKSLKQNFDTTLVRVKINDRYYSNQYLIAVYLISPYDKNGHIINIPRVRSSFLHNLVPYIFEEKLIDIK